MTHSSAAVSTPPSSSAPLAFAHALISPRPVDVSILPLPFRSTHWPFSASPISVTEPLAMPPTALASARFPTQTLPFASTAVADGSFARFCGADQYSPSTLPVLVSTFTTVPRAEAAIQMTPDGFAVSSSWSWSGVAVLRFTRLPVWKSALVVHVRMRRPDACEPVPSSVTTEPSGTDWSAPAFAIGGTSVGGGADGGGGGGGSGAMPPQKRKTLSL